MPWWTWTLIGILFVWAMIASIALIWACRQVVGIVEDIARRR